VDERQQGQAYPLIYGHYDVQPADPLELWHSDPFKAEVRGRNLYARGASDDKGQIFMHIKAVEAYLKSSGKLPVNVKFIIEGEEEIGGPSLDLFIEQNAGLLASNVALISDTGMPQPDLPALTYALRGLCYMEIEVTGPRRGTRVRSGARCITRFKPCPKSLCDSKTSAATS
jgi:acetylornithine deacetylase/succinyl-diaminopimelate desuccinylase-like protein